jgi:hypothetical protein
VLESLVSPPLTPAGDVCRIPDFPVIYSRVTRRFQEDSLTESRLDTSELIEQVCAKLGRKNLGLRGAEATSGWPTGQGGSPRRASDVDGNAQCR